MKKITLILILILATPLLFADYYAEFFIGAVNDSLYNNGAMSFSFYGGGNNGFWEGVGFTLSCPLEIVGNDSLWTNTTHWTQANISLDIPFRLAITF